MSSQELSIVIVDDLQFSRIVVKTALKKAGYNGVRMADNATEALTMLEHKPADVVLADWVMPEMNGLELTAKIRQGDEEKGTYTAIILFTANDGMEYLVRAFDHGVDDYLCKPPNPLELAARVNAAARVAAMQNDLLETSRRMSETIKHLQIMSLLDELTGAGNQRFLIRTLKTHIEEASTRHGGVCLALVELCELPHLRMQYGENIVNEILISQHRRLRRAVRPTDTVARLNDDSFGIIMHHTKVKDYKQASIRRVLTMIDNRAYKTSIGNLVISGRIGVYYYRGNEVIISAEELFKRARQKLQETHEDQSLKIAY